MSNIRKLNPKLMLRVQACAILFMASKRKERIEKIAEAQGITLDEASIMYTLGALKRAKRQGTARNYEQALDNLEAEQAGDRGNPITKSIQADKLSRYIDKLNRKNKGDKITIDGVQYINDYNIVSILEGEQITTPHFTIIDNNAKETKSRTMGKVMGTLYTKWQEQTEQTEPVNELHAKEIQAQTEQVEKNLKLFFNDYQARLSHTSRKRLQELADSDIDAMYLMSYKGLYEDKETKKLAQAVYTLYRNFPHKESISNTEFIALVREYIDKAA